MFAAAGTLYVYTIHAKYCMNISTEGEGVGSAVLIRAVEPLWGLATMEKWRGQSDPRRLMRGPAMLCQALGITTEHDGLDLLTLPWLAITPGEPVPAEEVLCGPRVGISRAQDLALRFRVQDSRYTSR